MSENISPTTGEIFYSGEWERIRDLLRVLNIGPGILNTITSEMVNRYQEMVDRDIDAILSARYHTPIIAVNKKQPDGVVRRIFPGDIVAGARYWTAGLLLSNEFQQLEQNTQEQVEGYIETGRRKVITIARSTHTIPGQELKGSYTRTMPPNLQPLPPPSRDW
jgi:hypothetical protein